MDEVEVLSQAVTDADEITPPEPESSAELVNEVTAPAVPQKDAATSSIARKNPAMRLAALVCARSDGRHVRGGW
ncbi:hypothetical protein DSCW_25790 [Desulfosarcina widdelii]|uniref:Uncharacterized protein n=1 Tax=Desulfosarcina widdelii TaxID=947919 RepID=A0A5K7YZM0_9BACT|nr:hypothetical protein DSCW_25790 [Desulfosarcina widdelii]